MINIGCKWALLTAGMIERRLSVVLFHRVLGEPDPMLPSEPDGRRFRERIEWLRGGFNILPLREATARLYAGTLPPRALCISFDDGYRDNATNALPILRDLGVVATFFVTTRYLAGGMMWNDRVIEAIRVWPAGDIDLRDYGMATIPRGVRPVDTLDSLLARLKYLPHETREEIATDLFRRSGARVPRMMVNEDEIRQLRNGGMEIGGHTVSHPILCSLPIEQARAEIRDNKQDLEIILGEDIHTFAYPNGRPRQDFSAAHIAELRHCGYDLALTTAVGTADRNTPPLQIPRFTPWDQRKGKYLARMVRNYFRQAEYLLENA